MIELKGVTVAKSGRKLFRNFGFRVGPGEHWLIQGENGSGKTTLLELLAGSLSPVEGHVTHSYIEGDDWDTRYQQRIEKIHFIPTHWIQTFLSGFEDLFYQQRYYSVEESELPKVSDILGDDTSALGKLAFSPNFDIRRLLDLHITRLSNGQLKKVIILRQLARNIPKLLILDYPFDGLDADSRRDLSNFIDDIAVRFNIQIVLTDHGHTLPTVINRRLVLKGFSIKETSVVDSGQQQQITSMGPPTEYIRDGQPVVEMRDLTISYGGRKIISKLNWRVNKGERWALTGKNGSGKTTLFSLIFADHPMAYSQQVFLFGKRRGTGESIWDIKNRINYLGPEQIHFQDHRIRAFTGREFIGMQPHARSGRLPELIAFFGAENYIDTPMRSLSSGHHQMVLLMNMFLDEKELLLLDEPFQFLDPVNHEKVTAYLNSYLDANTTLIMITHDEKDVAKWTQLRKVI